MPDDPPLLSLVIPVFKNESGIPALVEAVRELEPRVPGELEIVFVVDGSPDRSHELLVDALPDLPTRTVIVELSRNFGAFAATRQGLRTATGEFYAVIAADLQEPRELVVEFFKVLVSGDVDIALGERMGRSDPRLTKLTSNLYWRVYRRWVQPDMPPGGVDAFGCNRAVRDALLSMQESHSSLVGLLIWSGFRRASVPYTRRTREHGRSAWTLRKRTRYMMDSAFSFSDLPIRVLLATGVAGLVFMLTASVVLFAGWLSGVVEVAGYTPLMLAILDSAAVIVFSLGIIASYVWRVYENTKERPLVLVRSVVRAGGGSDA
jgi:glycosyltransferase involved in cell wall biosynthesis